MDHRLPYDSQDLARAPDRRERAIREVNGEGAQVLERLACHADAGQPLSGSQLRAVAMMLRRGAFEA